MTHSLARKLTSSGDFSSLSRYSETLRADLSVTQAKFPTDAETKFPIIRGSFVIELFFCSIILIMRSSESALLKLKNAYYRFFLKAQSQIINMQELVKFYPKISFEPLRYSRTFQKIGKVENRPKNSFLS